VVLVWRSWMLRMIERLYWIGTFAGSVILLALGGMIPVMRGWLRNEIEDWSDIVATLGGVWFRVETQNPDSDLGPVLARVDAPCCSRRSRRWAGGWASNRRVRFG